MKPSNLLFKEMDKISEYLVQRKHPLDETELFYEFCYKILVKARGYDECNNVDLADSFVKDSLSDIHLALYGMIYGET